jgi:hypothetical protein
MQMHQMHQMHHGQRGDGMMGFAAGEAFARADINNDGKVTRDEANAWLAARFAEIDANKDGGLTLEEIRAFYTARRGEGRGPPEGMRERMETHQAARFRFVDADLDGKIAAGTARHGGCHVPVHGCGWRWRAGTGRGAAPWPAWRWSAPPNACADRAAVIPQSTQRLVRRGIKRWASGYPDMKMA